MKTSTWIIILLAVLLVVGILYFDDEDFAQDVSQVANTVEENVVEVAEEVAENVDEVVDEAVDEVADVAENVVDGVDTVANAVANDLEEGAEAVVDGINSVEDALEEGDPVENPDGTEGEQEPENVELGEPEAQEGTPNGEAEMRINNYIEEFDVTTFDTEVAYGESVALFFHADRCPTCVALNSDIKENMDDLQNVKVYKVDYDTQEELKAEYGVTSQHTVVFIKDGEVVKTSRGTINSAAQLDEESL